MSDGNQRAGSDTPDKRAGRKAQASKHGFWRTNVEAFTVAIVMALVIKQFAFEAFQVPTESMEPSIIGRQSSGDRIIVSKGAALVKEPQRWEVWVFHYPLSSLVNYVKRVIGLPGEEIKIVQGDIYAAPEHGGQYKVARKSVDLQETLFRSHPVIPEADTTEFRLSTFMNHWQVEGAKSAIKDGVLHLDAGKAERIVLSRVQITNERHDEAAADRETREDANRAEAVGDLRLALGITPEEGSGALIMTIKDGTQPRLPIRLELAVEGGGRSTKLTFGGRDITDEELGGFALPADEEAEVSLDNVDDTIYVIVDGDVIFRHEYVQALERSNKVGSQVSFGLTNGKASFARIALYRDLFHTHYQDTPTTFLVPDGHYFFLGDNSPNSLDARGWRVVGIRLVESGEVLLGDMEAVSDELGAPRQRSNPWLDPDGDPRHHYIDIQGNHWRLEPGSYDILYLGHIDKPSVEVLELHGQVLEDPKDDEIAFAKVNTATLRQETSHSAGAPFQPYSRLMHFTSRENIIGQAFFVFWPPARMGAIR